MNTFIKPLTVSFALFCVCCVTVWVAFLFPTAIFAADHNPDRTTTTFTVRKILSGADDALLRQFEFRIVGGSIDTIMRHEDVIDLPAGNYAITEIGPAGYVVVFWAGDCDEVPGTSDSKDASFAITPDDITDRKNVVCSAENELDTTPTNATVTVNKVVVNDNGGTTATSSFSFTVNGGESIAFEADGSNVLSLPTGVAYSIVENATAGYVASHSAGCTVSSLTANGTTCTITNDDTAAGGGGTTDTYRIEGYVWHDANSNDNWEKDNAETEEVEASESDLEGWTVTITNGTASFSTVTDANGFYSFNVVAGTWTITETVQNEWSQTFPNSGSHVVTVPAVVTEARVPAIFAWFIRTAQAATLATYGPYDFGNVFTGCTSNCGGGGGGGGGGNGGGGGGSGTKISQSGGGSSGGNSNSNTPKGEVLGATAPIGAPNAGMGGMSTAGGFGAINTLSLMFALAIALFFSRRQIN